METLIGHHSLRMAVAVGSSVTGAGQKEKKGHSSVTRVKDEGQLMNNTEQRKGRKKNMVATVRFCCNNDEIFLSSRQVLHTLLFLKDGFSSPLLKTYFFSSSYISY